MMATRALAAASAAAQARAHHAGTDHHNGALHDHSSGGAAQGPGLLELRQRGREVQTPPVLAKVGGACVRREESVD